MVKAAGSEGSKISETVKHLLRLYEKKRHCIKDYLHKMTHFIADYCMENDIHTVVAGDITGIRKGNDLGRVTNQKLHALPYAKMYGMLSYKLAQEGIRFVLQEESWTSQCSPLSESVSEEKAERKNRVQRGKYCEGTKFWNADAVGAYNILRKYKESDSVYPVEKLSSPEVIKAAV